MQDKSTYLFAAETEAELEGWVTTLKKVLVANEAAQAQQDRFIRGNIPDKARVFYLLDYVTRLSR